MSTDKQKKIKIFLAVNYKLVLECLSSVILKEDDFEIAESTNNLLDLINGIESLDFDILIIDTDLENLDLKKIISLNNDKSGSNIILLIDKNINENKLVEYVRMGVKGYFYKENKLEQFLKSIRLISEGELWVERKLLPKIIDNPVTPDQSDEDLPLYDLTQAEFRILKFVLKGHSNLEIAKSLSISDKTVKFHLYKIFKKLSIKTRSQLIIFGYQNGLVS
ncbi:MAG: response regulator transcription factor [Thermodesulfobacteriota bacterium]